MGVDAALDRVHEPLGPAAGVEQEPVHHLGALGLAPDLLELGLPFMDEPQHPSKRMYSKPHTLAWSERVDATDAFVFVTPEYNHSYAPAIKNAIDFLFHEWWRKPWISVAYGGESSGTPGAATASYLSPLSPTT